MLSYDRMAREAVEGPFHMYGIHGDEAETGLCGKADDTYKAAWRESHGGEQYVVEQIDGGKLTPNQARNRLFPNNDNDNRRGDFLATFTGRKFWPLDPRAEDVCIEDIAHSLAMQCRYGGHSISYYSVAEHSVHIYRWLVAGNYAQDVRLSGLLHDATEAYVADVPRPLKRHLPGYKEAETAVWRAAAEAFGLSAEMPEAVHEADNRILGDEIARLMIPMDWHAKYDDPLGVEIECWPPARAEAEFLRAFYYCQRLRETGSVAA